MSNQVSGGRELGGWGAGGLGGERGGGKFKPTYIGAGR